MQKIWNNLIVDTKYYCARGLFFDHWFFPLSVGLESARYGYQASIAVGDSAFAGYCKYAAIYNIRANGTSLNDLENEIDAAFAALKYIHDEEYYYIITLEKLNITQLKKGQVETSELTRGYNQCIKKSSSIVKRFGHITYGQLLYILGNRKEAFAVMQEAEKLNKFARPFIWNQDFWAIYCMLIIDEYPTMSFKDKIIFKFKLKLYSFMLKKWNKIYPNNLEHKHLLIQAELKRFSGDYLAASNLYDQAIESAKKNGFKNYVAIINERAAKFYAELNKEHFSKHYILEAYYAYQQWGADYKCRLLENENAKIITEKENTVQQNYNASSLDLAAIIKANQAISREINLNKILEKIMQVSLQEAGAETGVLLRKQSDDSWSIEAKINLDKLEIYNKEMLLADKKNTPMSLINYTSRTKDVLVLQNLSESSEMPQNVGVRYQDEYLLHSKPKSVIVLPILYQNEVKRILYLENNAGSNAFTKQQISSLKLLSSQIAISLENAEYYDISGRFVPFSFLERLSKKSLTDVHLGDQVEISLSVLFCDIRDFTSLSEQLSPEETLEFVNQFWGLIEPVIDEHGGFIDKYIGDAIMVLFDDPPDQAVKAGLEILKKLEVFNLERQLQNKPVINIGIGINTGNVILGIVGTEKRMSSSVMGDVVNIASRIEDLTKQYKTPLLISDATKEKLNSPELFDLNLIGKVLMRGKSASTKVWEVHKKIVSLFLH